MWDTDMYSLFLMCPVLNLLQLKKRTWLWCSNIKNTKVEKCRLILTVRATDPNRSTTEYSSPRLLIFTWNTEQKEQVWSKKNKMLLCLIKGNQTVLQVSFSFRGKKQTIKTFKMVKLQIHTSLKRWWVEKPNHIYFFHLLQFPKKKEWLLLDFSG